MIFGSSLRGFLKVSLAREILTVYQFSKLKLLPNTSIINVKNIAKCIPSSSLISRVYSTTSNFLEVEHPNLLDKPLKLHPQWLRDHCRCPECYNSVTFQRNNNLLDINENTVVSNYVQQGETIQVDWSDGHKSTYSVSWLFNNTFEGKYHQRLPSNIVNRVTTWDGATVNRLELKPIIYEDLMKDEAVLSEVFRRVVQFGFAKIEQVPPEPEDETLRVIERICRMSSTLFGTFWKTGILFDHKDTGYLNGYLEAHTDNTYFSEAQGYLFFHCTHFHGTGGESFLVDGFHVAEQLKQQDPEAYRCLSDTQTEAEYIEPGEHFTAWGPCFRHHPISHHLEQIRFNLLDRAPLSSIPQSKVGEYYSALRSLTSLVKRKENEYWFRLTPGSVCIIDNWRLLHGRAAYEGERILRGCYYSRSDFMSRARHFKVIV